MQDRRASLLLLSALLAAPPALATGEYMAPEEFLRGTFGAAIPAPAVLWPSPETQARIRATLGGRSYKQLRIRYWRQGSRTAWILGDIGKTEEITLGFVVQDGAIERSEVLAFREERGWEIRFPSFRKQFQGMRLTEAGQLSQPVDGITGATLSVNAYGRLARLALQLHREVVEAAP